MIANRTGSPVSCSIDGIRLEERHIGEGVVMALPTGSLPGMITSFNHAQVWVLVNGEPVAKPVNPDVVHFERPTAMELKQGGGY